MSANGLRSLLGGCRDVSRRVAAICVALFVLPLLATGAVASERVISLYNIHTKDNITVVFKRGGRYDEAALKRLNWFLRDWRQGTQTKIDPKLFDLLSDIHTELGSQRPIHVISGFRSPKTNALLRKTRGGQARKSRHMRGQAIDVHFPDVPVRQLRYSALVRQAGGVGYYPTSSLPFVHVDTGRVRHWPRMSRTELALLFPSGRTRHVPSDRKPLTRADYRNAKSKRPKLAIQVAQFRAMRSATGARRQTLLASLRPRGQGQALRGPVRPTNRAPQPRLRVASAGNFALPSATPVPRLLGTPRIAPRPAVAATVARDDQRKSIQSMLGHLARLNKPDVGTADQDRSRLTQLAALAAGPLEVRGQAAALAARNPAVAPSKLRTAGLSKPQPAAAPRLVAPPRFAAPAEFDEEHPEELSYSPFPVSPYLTDTPSFDDDALVVLAHPDGERTLAVLSEAGSQPMVRFTPGPAVANLTEAQAFRGAAIRVAHGLLSPPEPAGVDQTPLNAVASR